jgi:hypothetical protein
MTGRSSTPRPLGSVGDVSGILDRPLFGALGPSAASAAPLSAGGPTALAVAAVLAPYSPLVSACEKRFIAGLFDGNAKAGFPARKKLTVTAETVTCRISNVAIAERSCELTFRKGKRSLKGREANEVLRRWLRRAWLPKARPVR